MMSRVAGAVKAAFSGRNRIRTVVFLLATAVFVTSAWLLLDDLVFSPRHAHAVTVQLREWYHTDTPQELQEERNDATVYPEGMPSSFRSLYRRNPDVRGWITFQTSGGDLFEGAVDNPIVQGSDNEYYLTHDFFRDKNKAGTLYFDYRNSITDDQNVIVYGHNLKSGLMFSHFNRLATGNLSYAKRVTTLTLDTWEGSATYKVFAVMIVNANDKEEPLFDYAQTTFAEGEFDTFVREIRTRSLYDFADVDVQSGDRLLTLSTCSNKRDTQLSDGRTVIVARRVREGESTQVDTTKTTLNADVLMPRQWYVEHKKQMPAAYQ